MPQSDPKARKRDEIAKRLIDNGMDQQKAYKIASATINRMVARGDPKSKFKLTPRKE